MSLDMPRAITSSPMSEPLILLAQVRQRFSQKELAPRLSVTAKTIGRWERRETECPMFIVPALREILLEGRRPAQPSSFSFIDLFAGIGGIRRGFEQAGGRCVFTSEWNEWAQKTYRANFPDDHELVGDIQKYHEADVPDHDVLLAGFPCQPFSIAGVSKKNALGRKHGFECETQGTLFFDVARIIAEKRPKAFLLENVKNLVSHDKGNTFRVIRQTLQDELGYHITAKVIDAQAFVPQHRERILIVGFAEKTSFTFNDFRTPEVGPRLKSILHPEDGSEEVEEPYTLGPKAKVNEKYVLTNKLWAYLQDYAAKHKAAGNGFGFGLVTGESVTRTLSARYYKDGSEILVSRGKSKNPRRLTPRECARLMGYEDFVIPVSDTQAYKQFGNSVVVPVMAEMARIMEPHIRALKKADECGVLQMPLLAESRK